ncbi:MAG TPA: cytochrome c [Bacteroidales bacterium]|nr:cytochrome c [Bacteroidales bacterium]HRX95828.1 cytochrome c [Bacteroidales bacterium]
MKKINLLSVLVAFTVVLLSSCGGGGTTETTETKEEPKQEVKETAKSPYDAQMELGAKLYTEKCVACHQADAKGIPNAFPPLAGSDYLLADPKRGIHQTLNGSHEEMVVNGATYNAPMTPQVKTKEEALAVINYVLVHFNGYNQDQLLKMEDIADIEINPMQINQPAQ